MRAKYLILLLVLVLVLAFTIACKGEARIEKLENRVAELQDELSSKEETITELQQQGNKLEKELEESLTEENAEKDSLSDEDIIIAVINNYISAVEKEDFVKQRKYVAKYALDLVNMKEFESKHSGSVESRTIDIEEPRVDSVSGNKAKGYISFTEHLKGYDGTTYDLFTEGKVYLEKINGDWKVVDYTRKNHLISEALYVFEELKKTHKDTTVSIDWALFSLSEESVSLFMTITNDTDMKLRTNIYSSTIVGPDRIQNETISYLGELGEIFPEAIAIGAIGYNWTNASTGNFILHFGDIYREDNYSDIINNLTFEIDLSQAVKY